MTSCKWRKRRLAPPTSAYNLCGKSRSGALTASYGEPLFRVAIDLSCVADLICKHDKYASYSEAVEEVNPPLACGCYIHDSASKPDNLIDDLKVVVFADFLIRNIGQLIDIRQRVNHVVVRERGREVVGLLD